MAPSYAFIKEKINDSGIDERILQNFTNDDRLGRMEKILNEILEK